MRLSGQNLNVDIFLDARLAITGTTSANHRSSRQFLAIFVLFQGE